MASPEDPVPLKPKSTQHNPVQLAHPTSSQICLTYNAAYHSCHTVKTCHTAMCTKKEEHPGKNYFTHSAFSYWFHPFDSLGIKKVVVSPGCELGTHLDKTSDTTRKASRLEAIKEA